MDAAHPGGAADVSVVGVVGHHEAGVEQQPVLVAPLGHHGQRVEARLQQVRHVLVGAAEDHVGPLARPRARVGAVLDVLAPDFTGALGVVQHALTGAEVEDEAVDGRPQQLVHALLPLPPRDGGLVHVDERVARVVVVQDAWSHGGAVGWGSRHAVAAGAVHPRP